MWKPDICVYHGGCDDGFGAAWVVRNRFGDGVAMVPGGYGDQLLAWPSDIGGRHILLVDFSLRRDGMERLAAGDTGIGRPASIVVLDHHKTAEDELRPWSFGPVDETSHDMIPTRLDAARTVGRPPIVAHFDMGQSGAGMAWRCFMSPLSAEARPLPDLVALIEDRDLWRFAQGERTHAFSAALRTYPHDMAVWDDIACRVSEVEKEGRRVLAGHRRNIEGFLENAYMLTIGEHVVPVVNVPHRYASDCGNALLARYPVAPFAACWHQIDAMRRAFLLRSENGRTDVSAVARRFGGGGHRNAAGFTVAMTDWEPLPDRTAPATQAARDAALRLGGDIRPAAGGAA